jgi:hypothetical protein
MYGAGFDGSSALVACCGGGGKYNYNVTAACGLPGAADPSKAVNWDGIHLTEAEINRRRMAARPVRPATHTQPRVLIVLLVDFILFFLA